MSTVGRRRMSVLGMVIAVMILQPAWPVLATQQSAPGQRVLRVHEAIVLCRSHPTAQYTLWVRGWFIPSITTAHYAEGGLFNSRQAVPLTTVDSWNINGNWKHYGALLTQIPTQTGVGAQSLTLHGLLTCATFRFRADADPFAPPTLKPVYGTTRNALDGPVTSWVSAGGLKLSVTVPHTMYPRDALVRVHVSIRNVSRHTVGYLMANSSLAGVTAPQAVVLNGSGNVLFPPAMPYWPAVPGPIPALAPLAPGHTVAIDEYVILRGAWLRASQPFTPHWALNTNPELIQLATRPFQIRLTVEHAPRLVLRGAPSSPSLEIQQPPNVSGHPRILDFADCGAPVTFGYRFWEPSNLRVTPSCAPIQAWHIRVAWLNHPVSAIDYTASVPTPFPVPTPTPTAVPSPTRTGTGPTFDALLRRAGRAMASVHTLHTEGAHVSIDASTQMVVHIHSDCSSHAGSGLPITLQTLRAGWFNRTRIDEGFILIGPVLPGPHTHLRAWERSPRTHQRWRLADLYKEWGLYSGISYPPAWVVNPGYINQTCPDVIRLTYLTSPDPYATHTVMGRQVLGGHRVWHLREQQYSKLDLFIDTATYRLLRLVLWDGHDPGAHWQVSFDYSRFNGPEHIAIPPPGTAR